MLAPRKRFIDVNSKYLGILILIGSLPKHTFGSKESLTNLWREPMSTYSVFATLRLRLFACNHNQILSKSSLSPNSISSIIFPLTVKLVSSANILAVVCLRQYDKSSIYTKKKRGPKLNPEDSTRYCSWIRLFTLVLPSTANVFLEALWLVHLISVFTFHFRCLCLTRTANFCHKKVIVLWSDIILPSARWILGILYKKEEKLFPYRMDDFVLLLNMSDRTSFNGLLLISLPRSNRGWWSLRFIR